jgi:uncharacterized protein (TIGR00730 family)
VTPRELRRVCVYCGSAFGTRAAYQAAAVELGASLAGRGIGLVYGGGSVGLMGTVADACLAAGGEVTGVVPDSLFDDEVAYAGLADLRTVASMHERKALMADLADGFVVLPGGLGTLDETMEALTWNQLGIQAKPVAFLDVGGFWEPAFALLDHLVAEGFVSPADRELALRAATPESALDALASWQPPAGRPDRRGVAP